MKLEHGKRYVTRGGHISEPAVLEEPGSVIPFLVTTDSQTLWYLENGVAAGFSEDDVYTLVREYGEAIDAAMNHSKDTQP